jgi:hypothetical protein
LENALRFLHSHRTAAEQIDVFGETKPEAAAIDLKGFARQDRRADLAKGKLNPNRKPARISR